MPRILLPSKDDMPPKTCEGKRPPVARGSYFEFELSQEEYKYWKELANLEREKIRQEAYSRCFYDILKEHMAAHPRTASNFFGGVRSTTTTAAATQSSSSS